MRWCFYQTNLFGDPSLVLYTKEESVPTPKIELGKITGGMFLSFDIKNIGNDVAEDVAWDLKVDGGIFGLISVDNNGILESIPSGEQVTIKLNTLILGLGVVKITASAECSTGSNDTNEVDGSVIIITTKIINS